MVHMFSDPPETVEVGKSRTNEYTSNGCIYVNIRV